ncbi:MAG: RluA family pseudouridine synthase [Myxococcales bacterium]|nr:RluA family pseudouridine synthase [Myxococcales bacterium]
MRTGPQQIALGQNPQGSDIGQRLDRALVAALAAQDQSQAPTRSQLARAFAAGQVRIGGRAVKPSLIIDGPLLVEVELTPSEPLAQAFPEDLPLTVVHEDPALLVVDKPAGMVVHAGPGHERGTLVNAVLHHLQSPELPVLPGNGPERPGVVHRLDRDTSGLMVFARTTAAQEILARQFRDHSIDRAYLGIVLGEPDFEERRVETLHGRDPTDRRRFAPDQGTRRAVTTLTVVRRLAGAALLRFTLETGRTHQIRMHARHVGCPIFADPLYGHRPRSKALRALADGLGRHALHAALLGFEHPEGGRVRFESALPAELQRLLTALATSAG